MDPEKERFIVIGIALFLTVLFVSYLGPVITGNVVKDTAEVTLADFPYPFIKNSLVNNVVIVVTDEPSPDELLAAHEIARFFDDLIGTRPVILVASQVAQATRNRIIIRKEGDLPAATGAVVLIPQGNAFDLVVSGSDDAGVRLAAKALVLYKYYHLEGLGVQVEGDLAAPYSLSVY